MQICFLLNQNPDADFFVKPKARCRFFLFYQKQDAGFVLLNQKQDADFIVKLKARYRFFC
jgi:hypothetical protein